MTDRGDGYEAVLSPVNHDWMNGSKLRVCRYGRLVSVESVRLTSTTELQAEATIRGKVIVMPVRVEPGENHFGQPGPLDSAG